ncbi:MAG: multiprotein bridging factor aMBF1 [Candidatus Nanohaloarchaea archaeon]|nr:multiprotein bridging factor aMBF1 [Candidatus Nanohaloarchaea archaeon]
MAGCEMCGAEDDLKETRVEGARLDLCSDCREVGDVVERSTPSTGTRSRSSSSTTPSTPDETVLPGYDDTVKAAREDRGLSIADLADALKEKESVVRRVETGKLTPDRDLARKFERELDIDIYGTPPETPDASGSSDGGGQTIGDVADVHRAE